MYTNYNNVKEEEYIEPGDWNLPLTDLPTIHTLTQIANVGQDQPRTETDECFEQVMPYPSPKVPYHDNFIPHLDLPPPGQTPRFEVDLVKSEKGVEQKHLEEFYAGIRQFNMCVSCKRSSQCLSACDSDENLGLTQLDRMSVPPNFGSTKTLATYMQKHHSSLRTAQLQSSYHIFNQHSYQSLCLAHDNTPAEDVCAISGTRIRVPLHPLRQVRETRRALPLSSDCFQKKRRTANAFILYRSEKARMIKLHQPSLLNGEISRVIADMWKVAGDEEKMPYIEEAKKLKRGAAAEVVGCSGGGAGGKRRKSGSY